MTASELRVPANGAELWVADSGGAGVPVVLISGGPGCCDYLEPVADLLASVARTVRFDARGCGRSSPVTTFGLEDAMADLEAIRKHLGVERWVVIGHSAGAEMALLYAMQHPDHTLGAAALAGGRMVDDRSWHAAYAQGRDAGREAPLDFAYPPNMEANRQLNLAWKAYTKQPSLYRELAAIQTPTLFVYGSEDIRPAWPAEQAANVIGARFVMLEGAGHHLWKTHAGALRRELQSFLATALAGS